VSKTFTQLLASGEGRYMTALEQDRAVRDSLELPRRMLVSRMLQQYEYSIVDYATNAFCEIMPDFEGPAGSSRRKKGHQDGRIILRYIAQAIREGSPDVLFEKVLSWLIGHLDDRNVSGKYMEVFFHFLQQGARRELPADMHPFVDTMFEQTIDYVRLSTYSGTIHRAHRRIAEFAVERVMSIVPDAKVRYGASSAPKCRRDFELLIKELARTMKNPSPELAKEDFARWLIDRLMNQVEYPADVWYWSFLALREGIIECCGPEAGRAVNDLFETMADRAEVLQQAVKLAEAAGDIASGAADKLVEMGEPLGLLRADEFKTQVSIVNRQLVSELAVLHACGQLDVGTERLARLWCDVVLPLMPSSETSQLAANLNALLKVVEESTLDDGVQHVFRSAIAKLVEVARRAESAERLAAIMDDVAAHATEQAANSANASPVASRACYRDIRVVLGQMISLIPAGNASTQGFAFRMYLMRYLLPNRTTHLLAMKQAYATIIQLIEQHARPEDARIARGFLEEIPACLDRQAKLSAVAQYADKFTANAVERGYQAAPRHESLNRHGLQAGRRDGAFLLERIVMTAVIGGTDAELALHRYFQNEIVRLSRLPGGVVVEFLRSMQEQLREFPEIVRLIVGLAQSAPSYTSAIKLDHYSTELATTISEQVINNSASYRADIGEHGLAACVRDNTIMLRGLATHLVESPHDVAPFKQWWLQRIGRHLNAKPNGYQATNPWGAINLAGLVDAMRDKFDSVEIDTVESYLKHVVQGEAATNRVPPTRNKSEVDAATSLSFSDVAV
jgi:hypothetical protein